LDDKPSAVHRVSSMEQRCHAGVFKIFPQNSNKFHLWFQISKISHLLPGGLRSTFHGPRSTVYGLRSMVYGLRSTVYGLRSTSEMRGHKIMFISCSEIVVLVKEEVCIR
jgi:hypothetical protein